MFRFLLAAAVLALACSSASAQGLGGYYYSGEGKRAEDPLKASEDAAKDGEEIKWKTLEEWCREAIEAKSGENRATAYIAMYAIGRRHAVAKHELSKQEIETLRKTAARLIREPHDFNSSFGGALVLGVFPEPKDRKLLLEVAVLRVRWPEVSEARLEAIKALRPIANDTCIDAMVSVAMADSSKQNRLEAISLLGAIGSTKADRALQDLARHRQSEGYIIEAANQQRDLIAKARGK